MEQQLSHRRMDELLSQARSASETAMRLRARAMVANDRATRLHDAMEAAA